MGRLNLYSCTRGLGTYLKGHKIINKYGDWYQSLKIHQYLSQDGIGLPQTKRLDKESTTWQRSWILIESEAVDYKRLQVKNYTNNGIKLGSGNLHTMFVFSFPPFSLGYSTPFLVYPCPYIRDLSNKSSQNRFPYLNHVFNAHM